MFADRRGAALPERFAGQRPVRGVSGRAAEVRRQPRNLQRSASAPSLAAVSSPELTGKYRPRRSSRPAESVESATICKQALSFPSLRSARDAVPPALVPRCCPPVVRLVIFASPADPAALQDASRAIFANNFHHLDLPPPLHAASPSATALVFSLIFTSSAAALIAVQHGAWSITFDGDPLFTRKRISLIPITFKPSASACHRKNPGPITTKRIDRKRQILYL